MSNIKRKPIIMDKKGRITIPEYIRRAFGLPDGEEYPLVIEVYPSLEECKTLFIKKDW